MYARDDIHRRLLLTCYKILFLVKFKLLFSYIVLISKKEGSNALNTKQIIIENLMLFATLFWEHDRQR